jgi:hypothetical protein
MDYDHAVSEFVEDMTLEGTELAESYFGAKLTHVQRQNLRLLIHRFANTLNKPNTEVGYTPNFPGYVFGKTVGGPAVSTEIVPTEVIGWHSFHLQG